VYLKFFLAYFSRNISKTICIDVFCIFDKNVAICDKFICGKFRFVLPLQFF